MADKLTTVEKEYKSAFLLDKAKLTRILGILEQRFKEVQLSFDPVYEITLSKGKKLLLPSVDELLSLDNTVRDPIRALIIKVDDSSEPAKSLSAITYGSSGTSGEIKLSITGKNSKWANQLFAELEEQVERTLLGSWIYKLGGESVLWGIFTTSIATIFGMVIFFVPSRLSSWGGLPKDTTEELMQKANQSSSLEEKIDFLFELNKKQLELNLASDPRLSIQSLLNLNSLFVAVPLLIALVCTIYAIGWCYPRGVFLWGDYEEYYNSLVSKRKMLWSVVIVTILLGIVTNLFVVGLSGFIQ